MTESAPVNVSDNREDHQRGEPDATRPVQLSFNMQLSIALHSPCPKCACPHGIVATMGEPVRCARCGQLCSIFPWMTTGRSRGSLRTRPDIPVRERIRVLLRDNCACAACRHHGVLLEVGHLISYTLGTRWAFPTPSCSVRRTWPPCAKRAAGLGSDSVGCDS